MLADPGWPRPGPGLVIAIVGAGGSGKSGLAQALAPRLSHDTGLHCELVSAHWPDLNVGTVPDPAVWATIAREQAQRIAHAATQAPLVLADTTPLVAAAHLHAQLGDSQLDAAALAWQRQCQLTLLMALDLPRRSTASFGAAPSHHEAVDQRLRHLLLQAGLAFNIVAGQQQRRLDAAVDAVSAVLRQRRHALPGQGLFTRLAQREANQPLWQWACDNCDQPDCEHALRQQRRARAKLGVPG